MPEFHGTLKPPLLAAAPSSPVKGQMYMNTTTNKLQWFDGTVWVNAEGGSGTPSGPAGGELRGTYPNPTLAPREGAGRVVGLGTQWEGPFSGVVDLYSRQPAVTYFNLSVTPSVACWWPVQAMALVQNAEQAWYVMNVELTLAPADAQGSSRATDVVQLHAAAGVYVSAKPYAMWALAPGVAYMCRLRTSYQSGGSNWFWYDGDNQHTFISSPGIMPR